MVYDVIVAGFGTAGAVAAISAARHGLKVLVLERGSYGGGTHTGGGVQSLYLEEPSGLLLEFEEKITGEIASGGLFADRPEAGKHIFEREFLAADGSVRYEAPVIGAVMDGKRVTGVRSLNRGRIVEDHAALVIDSTADTVFCRSAGCEFFRGRESDGAFQPFTNTICRFFPDKMRTPAWNFDAGRIDPHNAEAFSKMMLASFLVHLKEDYSEHRDLAMLSDLPGIRESGHAVTETVLSFREILDGSRDVKHPIARVNSNIDTHARDIALESRLLQDYMTGCSLWGIELSIAVPYRVMVPRGIEGLLIAGRHIGVDHDLGHALRMIGLMGALGEAAGVAAYLCVKHGCAPSRIDERELASFLKTGESPAKECAPWPDSPDAILAGLNSGAPGRALWGARNFCSKKILRQWFDAAPDGSLLRCNAAFALALKGDSHGAAELRRMAAERDPYMPSTSRKYNHARGYVSVYFLGRLADAASIPLIGEILADGNIAEHGYEYRTTAFRALLDIGEKHPAHRAEIARRIRTKAEDPDWVLETRLKGTAGTMKRMDPLFRLYAAKVMKRWGFAHKIAGTMKKLPLDPHDAAMAAVRTPSSR
ncbi:MAG: hypothetical protein BWY31_00917 [Lentisphaerae bacterium ADurb.Bin242]|nr:MAG: hypothetical protein BWY31_00917 [Lentisphaerae bacterium ADurb.Bin242]